MLVSYAAALRCGYDITMQLVPLTGLTNAQSQARRLHPGVLAYLLPNGLTAASKDRHCVHSK